MISGGRVEMGAIWFLLDFRTRTVSRYIPLNIRQVAYEFRKVYLDLLVKQSL